MTDVFVGRLMSSPVVTVTPETPVREAAAVLLDREIGSLVVVDDDDAFVGILTTTDFVRITADDAIGSTVDEYMTTDVTTAGANDSINDVAGRMIDGGFHHLPVVDEEAGVVGMLTTTDLTAYLSTIETPPSA